MNNLLDYQVRFLDPEGALMEEAYLLVETLSAASDCARVIAADIGAAEFIITMRNSRPH